mmetsp:Transcript_2730/g.3196  ORF Transcript_2730/g.3196 Transcript_2730/m.3196 type:complete len:385 (-) Transcript_2730:160-1314(-)|eukprot:CAMPEP_0184035456 /NCGR_PEP_ID=MMETSP0955-20130417/25793_1 /TAXON_ID=627963 /ORGANISM="Aplanochytrium sp, Strain PBS07" /LENGTH=384 /DNA_ID=CAMNT_0026322601 /DNA_START=360 /DNA_END=1514 /DNA_ORIENTATION=-
MEGNVPGGWQPESSWIVIEENQNRSHGAENDLLDGAKADSSRKVRSESVPKPNHPDSVWFEDQESSSISSDDEFSPKRLRIEKFFDDDTYESENTLRLTPALGLHSDSINEINSMAQAERALGLTVSLDGVDPAFIKKSSKTIMERSYVEAYRNKIRDQQQSPFSKSSISSSDQDDSEPETEKETKLPRSLESESDEQSRKTIKPITPVKSLTTKYGGRAPPILGALAPPAQKSSAALDVTTIKTQLDSLNIDVCKKVDIVVPFSKQRRGSKTPCNELYPSCASGSKSISSKSEKRRVRRRKTEKGAKRNGQSAKKGKKNEVNYSWQYVWGYNKGFNFRSMAPLVVSHVFTLLIGIYIGRKFSSNMCSPAIDKTLVKAEVLGKP